MYISVSQASAKFNISSRKLQTLCRQGKIPKAHKVGGVWLIPEDSLLPCEKNSHSVVDTPLTIEQLCLVLSISKATAKNWLRLGKIHAGADGKFDIEYVTDLKEKLSQESTSALKSRRNKSHMTGSRLYDGYIHDSENHQVIERFIDSYKTIQTHEKGECQDQLPMVLAAFAIEMYRQATGLSDSKKIDRLFSRLIEDLLGPNASHKPFSANESVQKYARMIKFIPDEDTLGFIYLSLRKLKDRKVSGSYFTPGAVADQLISQVSAATDLNGKTICDSCCGTGMFLLKLALTGVPLENLYGQDLDEISIKLMRINMYLLWLNGMANPLDSVSQLTEKKDISDLLYSHFTVCDSLLSSKEGQYHVIIGNPPWGSNLSKEYLKSLGNHLETAKSSSCESSDIFVEKSIKFLRSGGLLAYVLPEAVLSVGAHRNIRRIMLRDTSFKFVHYLGNVFPGVQCPAIILGLQKTAVPTTIGCQVFFNTSYEIKKQRHMTCDSFSFSVDDGDFDCLEAIESVKSARYLKGNAKFALGIVTGDNHRFISSIKDMHEKDSGKKPANEPVNEPIFRGSNVFRYSLSAPHEFISFQPEKFQQVAPKEVYRSKEKLLYRFICRVPVFALDTNQTLSLNSCNVLVPQIDGLAIKYILAVLNSSAAAFYIGKKYNSVKLLRSHIESLPIPWVSAENQAQITRLVDEIMTCSGARKLDLYRELDDVIGKLYGLDEEQLSRTRKYSEEGNLFLD